MNEIKTYVESGLWVKLYADREIGSALGMVYNLFKWLERDQADELNLFPEAFVWSRGKNRVGEFPLMVQPEPSWQELLTMILERDTTIQRYLSPVDDLKTLYQVKFVE